MVLESGGFASALLYTDSFPSEDSTVIASVGVIDAGELGYFWSQNRGDSGTYEISMVVSEDVPFGRGSIALGSAGNMTLTGDVIQPVPEPATILLIGSGLAGMAGLRKKLRPT